MYGLRGFFVKLVRLRIFKVELSQQRYLIFISTPVETENKLTFNSQIDFGINDRPLCFSSSYVN